MQLRFLVILFLLFVNHFSSLGQKNGLLKEWEYSIELLGGASRLYSFNTPDGVKYPSAELNLRFNTRKRIKNRIYFTAGVNFTEKFKRKSYYFQEPNVGLLVTKEPTAQRLVDQALSTSNNRALGIPIQLQFESTHHNLSITGGVLLRYWMPNRQSLTWVLSSSQDAGLLLSVHRKVIGEFLFGIEGYYGLINMNRSLNISNTTGFMANKSVNQYLQFSLSYRFLARKRLGE